MMKNELRRGFCGILAAFLLFAALAFLAVRLAPPQTARSTEEEAQELREIEALCAVPAANAAVQPLLEIERCWEIEDTHQETPGLVARMTMDGSELGFDAESHTFYCSLGMKNESWPELPLSAAGPDGLQAAWTDDYAWDEVASAIASGTAYQLIAWTETEYEYFHIVFTGLPVVTLHTQDWAAMNDDYMPSRLTVSAAGYAGIDSPAEAHLRSGGDNRSHDKLSYRVAFKTENKKGRLKDNALSVLDMGEDSDWLLIASPKDNTCLLNHLGFDLWNRWNPDGDAFALLPNRMVELFVEDQYQGIYGMQPPVRPKKELARVKNGENGLAARIVMTHNPGTRPRRDVQKYIGALLELRRRTDKLTDEQALALFDDYAKLSAREGFQLEDDAFLELAEKRVNLRDIFNYWLFFQAVGLGDDNVWNNAWVWAVPDDSGELRYSVSPWDMDMCFEGVEEQRINRQWTLPIRLLTLDALGSRELVHALWTEKRGTILTRDAFNKWLEDAGNELTQSGAYARESQKWWGEAMDLELDTLMNKGWDRIMALEACLNEEWPVTSK